ncbi:MAG TPA: hypothetical protein VK540_15995 [Polyangiaceae bacterium]|nr:hypothetical protein [Polyangiaceae bacterium]
MLTPELINEALDRCSRHGHAYALPGDFDCHPIVIVVSGRCVSLTWRARVGTYVGNGDTAEEAVTSVCQVTP